MTVKVGDLVRYHNPYVREQKLVGVVVEVVKGTSPTNHGSIDVEVFEVEGMGWLKPGALENFVEWEHWKWLTVLA